MTPAAIRSARKRLALSRDNFALRLGFTGDDRRRTVSRWESGERKPSPQTVTLIKQLLAKPNGKRQHPSKQRHHYDDFSNGDWP
jgi:DNA-binding transcriptional regulator YiaG